jgi:hypothetical protein
MTKEEKDELVKKAKTLLEKYEKAEGSLKDSLSYYIRQIHQDLLNAGAVSNGDGT